MSKTWRCLGRSLVRLVCSRSSIGLAVLTFCSIPSFADDEFNIRRVALIRWQSFDKVYGTINSASQPLISAFSEDDVLHALESSTFGIKMNYNRNTQNRSFIVPARTTNVTFSTSLNALSITNSLQGSIGGQACVASVYRLPKVRSMLTSCATLYCSGYVGPGMPDVFVSGDIHCVNIDYPSLLADVLSSTNTVFRQILLGHLNSIQTSVQNIEVNLGGLQSSVDSVGSTLNTISSDLSSSVSALASFRDSFVNANPLSLVSVSNLIDSANQLGYIDYNKYEEWMNSLSQFSTSFYDDNPSDRQLFFDEVVSTISSVNSAYGFLRGLDRTLLNDPSSRVALSSAGSYLNSGVLDVLGDSGPDSLNSKAGSPRGIAGDIRQTKLQLRSWKDDLHSDLQSWKQDLKSDLQAWKTSDESGYLNVRRGLDDINSNFSVPVGRGYTNTVPYYAYQTNVVVKIITNVVEQSAADIQSNATSNVDRQIKDSKDRWDEFKDLATGNGEGLNVKVKFPLWESDGFHVNVRDDAVVAAIQDGVTIVSPDLTHISDSWDSFLSAYSPTNSFDWEPWFEKWVPFSEIVTNYYAEFNASAPASEIAAEFLERGFDSERYSSLPWFERVEVLLAMIADVRSNSVEVADIQESMERQVSDFQGLSTNVVSVSSDVVGLFQYVQRFSSSLQSMFGDRAAPLTGDYVLLSAGHWIGDQPLVLRVNPTIQNLCRLIMQCIWYLGFLVLLWVVVNWCWQKVVAVLRWLWSMFDV